VAALSGDARRALDICRRATELVGLAGDDKGLVTMSHVDTALQEMYSAPKIVAIRSVLLHHIIDLVLRFDKYLYILLSLLSRGGACQRHDSGLVVRTYVPVVTQYNLVPLNRR